jgi:hypothetical protein
MLKRDDLREMGLPIAARNKIARYIEEVLQHGKENQHGLKVMELMMNSIV